MTMTRVGWHHDVLNPDRVIRSNVGLDLVAVEELGQRGDGLLVGVEPPVGDDHRQRVPFVVSARQREERELVSDRVFVDEVFHAASC